MTIINVLTWIFLGAVSGFCLAWVKSSRTLKRTSCAREALQQQYNEEQSKLAGATALAEERNNIISQREEELNRLQIVCRQVEKDFASLNVKKEALEAQIGQQDKNAEEMRKRALLEFGNLARSILDEKTKIFDEKSQKDLKGLIEPLQKHIKTFQENIDKKYDADLRDRLAFKHEIRAITDTGKELKGASEALTKVLRGDSQAQGKWGELVLERILESSGLRKGEEFSVQTSYNNEDGDRLRPDVTVYLSNQKHIFIDSKVSLTHYDKYLGLEDDFEKSLVLAELETAFCTRIKELSEKKYPAAEGVAALDFVLMFTPIESVLSLVAQNYSEKRGQNLFEFAWEKGVIITSPLTLMPILKTIDICWKVEYQNKNAVTIAEEAGKMYDKFCVFVNKLEKIGDSISKSQECFEDAKKTLSTGKGSLIRKSDHLRTLLKKERKISGEYFDEDEVADDIDVAIEKDNSVTLMHQANSISENP